MRIAYANAYFRPDSTTGGNAHVRQFIANAAALGHNVWTWPGDQHPDAQRLPAGRLARLAKVRRMDVVCVRIEWTPAGPCRWALQPYRGLVGAPTMVWEFNTVPEFGGVAGAAEDAVGRAVDRFRRYGKGCDLAICVSAALTDYVKDTLGIHRALTVPNGSDPTFFRPDAQPVRRMRDARRRLNVVWMGSASLPWHNLDLLRRTAEVVWAGPTRDEIAFHILGHGFTDIAEMPLNVHYQGPVLYDELPAWLAGMHVGLVLYRPGPGDFSSPLKLFDYMASGLAVVGTPQPQFVNVLDELDQRDQLVPADDPEALAAKLAELAAHRERVTALGRAARQLVIQKYTWRRTVQDVFCAIETTLAERAS